MTPEHGCLTDFHYKTVLPNNMGIVNNHIMSSFESIARVLYFYTSKSKNLNPWGCSYHEKYLDFNGQLYQGIRHHVKRKAAVAAGSPAAMLNQYQYTRDYLCRPALSIVYRTTQHKDIASYTAWLQGRLQPPQHPDLTVLYLDINWFSHFPYFGWQYMPFKWIHFSPIDWQFNEQVINDSIQFSTFCVTQTHLHCNGLFNRLKAILKFWKNVLVLLSYVQSSLNSPTNELIAWGISVSDSTKRKLDWFKKLLWSLNVRLTWQSWPK